MHKSMASSSLKFYSHPEVDYDPRVNHDTPSTIYSRMSRSFARDLLGADIKDVFKSPRLPVACTNVSAAALAVKKTASKLGDSYIPRGLCVYISVHILMYIYIFVFWCISFVSYLYTWFINTSRVRIPHITAVSDTSNSHQHKLVSHLGLLGGGLTRIAVRKYTFFGVHPAGKHFGNGPGMLPNINCLSVYMGIQHFGYACVMLPSTSCWSVHMGVSR